MKRRFTFLAAVGLALASVWYSGKPRYTFPALPDRFRDN